MASGHAQLSQAQREMLIDSFLPEYQTAERHTISINASAETVYSFVRSLDMSKSRLIRGFFRLRGLPSSALSLEGLQRMRFAILGEVPNQELLLGLVGRFWTLGGDLQRVDAVKFREFSREGYAKAAWNFSIEPRTEEVTHVATETRILCLDEASYRRFRLYWLLIGPFSAWIRREALRVIKREAEGKIYIR